MGLKEYKEQVEILAKEFKEKRDVVSYEKLYYFLKPYFFNVIKKYYVKNRIEIETILSDVFTMIYLKMDTHKDEYNFYNWLFTILINSIFTYLKDKKRHRAYKLNENFISMHDSDEEDLLLGFLNIEDAYKILLDVIDKSIYKRKDILYDKWINNMSYKELILKYNQNEMYIKNSIHVGKCKIIEDLEKVLKVKINKKIYNKSETKHERLAKKLTEKNFKKIIKAEESIKNKNLNGWQ